MDLTHLVASLGKFTLRDLSGVMRGVGPAIIVIGHHDVF